MRTSTSFAIYNLSHPAVRCYIHILYRWKASLVNSWVNESFMHFKCNIAPVRIKIIFIREHLVETIHQKLTNSVERSQSWEDNSCSASQGIPRLFWNANFHCRVHKITPPVPILSHMNSVYTILLYLLKIGVNIILPSTLTSSHTRYMLPPSHPPWFDHPNNTCWYWSVTFIYSQFTVFFRATCFCPMWPSSRSSTFSKSLHWVN
jgi:hypothetical protein